MADAEHPPHLTNAQLAARIRLGHILFWHTRPEDSQLTDDAFIRAVMARYDQHRGKVLVDPNE
jgi:hypothetical protein